jgi:glucose/arabinose dehydrogenase
MQAVLIFGELIAAALGGEDGRVRDATGRQSFDVQRRQLWTSDNLRGTPEPPDPYATEDAFPRLKFFEPLSVGVVPGSNRLGMATRPGKIYTFANRPSVTQADLLIDIGRTTYGLVFHPRFAENRYFYVTYVLDLAKTEPEGSRLSRFEASRTDPPVADPTTERIILEWPSGGHNGGCMRFGPEGDLYLSTGDGSGIADELLTGQDLGDLLGAILRIDVSRFPARAARSGRSAIDRCGSSASTGRAALGRRGGAGPMGDGLSHRARGQPRLERQRGESLLPAGAEEGARRVRQASGGASP